MKIKILISAVKDLEEGRIFYENQGGGLGDYFFLAEIIRSFPCKSLIISISS